MALPRIEKGRQLVTLSFPEQALVSMHRNKQDIFGLFLLIIATKKFLLLLIRFYNKSRREMRIISSDVTRLKVENAIERISSNMQADFLVSTHFKFTKI